MRASIIARRAAPIKSWTLANGQQVPKIGFGTWKLNKEQAHSSVAHALKTGFRHIDSAWAYKNEDATGEAIRKSGVSRQELFITSKLWNTFHGDKVEAGLDTTLKDLGVDYLDLYLMHWPIAFSNPNTSQISSLRSSGGYPVEEVELSQDLALTWRKMEEMVRKGKVRSIGISNFNIRRTEELLNASTETNPVVNQVEVNFGVPNDELLLYSEAHQIMLQAYSPLGAHTYREKYLEDPVITEVAQRNNMTPAQVQLAWPLARGIIPITRSSNPAHIEENFAAASKELPWDDVVHLTQESQARPIDRSMDPSETWATQEDIFEDYKDQTMLGALKDTTFEAPPAHESDGSHYLEPRNDPEAPQVGPGGTAVREMHTMTSPLTGSVKRSTVMQQLQRSKPRFFSTSTSARAVAEAAPPSAEEVPAVGQSILLRNSAKTATQTPGIRWTDGEEGIERQVRKMNMYTAIRDAQSHALASDDSTLVFGEDVSFGGVFRSTMGLVEEYGRERVFNTPLTEQGIIGFGIGAAAMGHTVVAEIQFADYIFPAFDQLVNEAAKYRFRSGGQHNAGKLTVRSPCMGVGHGALYHSQSVEQFFMPAAGLKVVIPRSPIQAKGLLLSAIREENPVVFLEPKILYRSSVEHVPVDDYTLPLSSAEVLQPGSDVTLISWGAPLYSCVQAIEMLRDPPASIAKHVPQSLRSASIELIDLRTILPWDRQTIAQSVAKTGRCVIVHEAPVTAGAGAEIAAHLQQSCFLNLEAPVRRIGGFDTPFPHVHETWYKPGPIQILDGLVQTLSY